MGSRKTSLLHTKPALADKMHDIWYSLYFSGEFRLKKGKRAALSQQPHYSSCQIFSRKLYVGFLLNLSGKKRNCPKSSIWSGQKLLVLRRIKVKTHKIWSESSGRALHQLSQHLQDCVFSRGNLSCSWFLIFFFLTWVSGLFQVLCWVRLFYVSVTFKSSSDVSVCACTCTCFCISQWDDGAAVKRNLLYQDT